MYTDIADSVYLLDVLVVVVHISHSKCWSTYYCTRIEVSVLRAGACGVWRGLGGGGWNFCLVTENVFSLRNVPGVLKRQTKKYFFGGRGRRKISKFFFPTKFFFQKCSWGADFGVFGAPHPTRGARGVGKRYTSSYDHDL